MRVIVDHNVVEHVFEELSTGCRIAAVANRGVPVPEIPGLEHKYSCYAFPKRMLAYKSSGLRIAWCVSQFDLPMIHIPSCIDVDQVIVI